MGANAVTTVPVYVAGEVLTAADMNITNSGIPVFASTVERDAAFGGTGEKTLAEGQYAYLESTNATQVYDGANWVSVGVAPGLVLVKTQTIGTTVSSVTVTDAFSATYDNYKILLSGGICSSGNNDLTLKFGASATGYYYQLVYGSYAGSALAVGASNASSALYAGAADTNGLSAQIELQSPFLAKYTTFQAQQSRISLAGVVTGFHGVATSFTDFVLTVNGAPTITGGTIRVYGYANS
jgi:hypothetical protein